MTKKTSVRITLDMPDNKHKELEALTTLNDTTINDLLLGRKEHQAYLNSSHIPNKETINAMQSAKDPSNLAKCESVEELFESLRINIKE